MIYVLVLLVEVGGLDEPHLGRVDKHDEEGDGERRLVECPGRLVLLLPLEILARRRRVCSSSAVWRPILSGPRKRRTIPFTTCSRDTVRQLIWQSLQGWAGGCAPRLG